MARIFVSYRHADSEWAAGAINKQLWSLLPDHEIFFDVDSIPAGQDFREHLERTVGICDYFIAIIGNGWAAAKDEKGARRLDDPNDWVRIEIETALRRGIPVIPVTISSDALPKSDQLPESLRELSFRQAMRVRPYPDFERDVERLARQIQAQESARQAREAQQAAKSRNDTETLEKERHDREVAELARRAQRQPAIDAPLPLAPLELPSLSLVSAKSPEASQSTPPSLAPPPPTTFSTSVLSASDPVVATFLWPTKWSYLEPGATSTIAWKRSSPEAECDGYELELLADGKLFEVIHQSGLIPASHNDTYQWKVSTTLPPGRVWQIRLTLRDKGGKATAVTSEYFPAAVALETRVAGAVIGGLAGLAASIGLALFEGKGTAWYRVGDILLFSIFQVPVLAAFGWILALLPVMRALGPAILLSAFGLGVWIAPEPTLQNRIDCGWFLAFVAAGLLSVFLFKMWYAATGRPFMDQKPP